MINTKMTQPIKNISLEVEIEVQISQEGSKLVSLANVS